jgi:hypothetical protein
MTIFFPDVSVYVKNYVVPAGTPALYARATLSSSYTDPTYAGFKAQAAHVGALFFAYHWLNHDNTVAQAQHAFAVAGDTPLMIDVEDLSGNTGFNGIVTFSDIMNFAITYRQLGGVTPLVYLPHWYWADHMGSPDLGRLSDYGLQLVSSNYPSIGYRDNGPGWNSYGGLSPVIWQYMGNPLDMNAYRGTYEQLRSLLGGAASDGWNAASHPTIQRGSTGPYVTEWQTDLLNVSQKQNIAGLNPQGVDGIFGPHTEAATRSYQWSRGLVSDGIVGPITWTCMHDRG